jgi:cystathionine beta-lyase/cystathionine gamma-synthase
VTRDEALHNRHLAVRTLGGAIPGPLEAWLALRGLHTLHVRLDRAQANAKELADRLVDHPAVTRVRFPGLSSDPGHALAGRQMSGCGAIVSIEIAGRAEMAQQTCARTRLWIHATSLGGVESTLERRDVGRMRALQCQSHSYGCQLVSRMWKISGETWIRRFAPHRPTMGASRTILASPNGS